MEFFIHMNCGAIRIRSSFGHLALIFVVAIASPSAFSLATEPTATHIDAAIERLGSATFLDREVATKELVHRGSAAIPQLETALKAAKGETRYRIRSILEKQRRSIDVTTRRAAEQALTRIALGKDRVSASWARSILSPPGIAPVPVETLPIPST